MHFCKKRSQGQRQQQDPVTAALYVLKILAKIEKEPPDYIRVLGLKAQRNQCQGLELG